MADPIYVHLIPEQAQPELPRGPFKAVVIVDEPGTAAWRDSICEWLVESGCLYCCVWGETCKAWHDAVDQANIQAFEGNTIPEDRFVMTTWHDKRPRSEVLWFVGNVAKHSTVELSQIIILHIVTNERSMEIINEYRKEVD